MGFLQSLVFPFLLGVVLALLAAAAKGCSFVMELLHSQVLQILRGLVLALIAAAAAAACLKSTEKRRKPEGCLDRANFQKFKLIERTQLSFNADKFRFQLPNTSVLGVPPGGHITCRGKDREGNETSKPYSPITLDSDIGYFELVIKMYPQGKMSHHFRQMRLGDYLDVKGPEASFNYQPDKYEALGMIAGGSGITPMFQIARAILKDTKNTKVHLVYANVTHEEILLKKELDDLVSKLAGRFMVFYVLNQPPESWNGGVGFVTKEMIQIHLPVPGSKIKVLTCGPPPMVKDMADHLENLGYLPEMVFQF